MCRSSKIWPCCLASDSPTSAWAGMTARRRASTRPSSTTSASTLPLELMERERFEKVMWKTMWLSSWPEKPGSVGWDAVSCMQPASQPYETRSQLTRQSQTRIATFLTLKDKSGGHLVHAVCTHYDDRGVVARAKSSLLIREAIREWVEQVESETHIVGERPKAPVILFGDFSGLSSPLFVRPLLPVRSLLLVLALFLVLLMPLLHSTLADAPKTPRPQRTGTRTLPPSTPSPRPASPSWTLTRTCTGARKATTLSRARTAPPRPTPVSQRRGKSAPSASTSSWQPPTRGPRRRRNRRSRAEGGGLSNMRASIIGSRRGMPMGGGDGGAIIAL